ncbi:unnamed protein product (macronuclear) [Paramecium tetraurelia]|uniref:Myb-like domain-containing protein n=1 Tax=Paramecium tetraurelia TaxID=5888 RepID=A0CLV1_PARTE|nr:uncharacterized protein GSPATT00038693001 [Paramecium tetraurelia]CAK71768.1 unnamed protein product [Paramecium tetraurelia]|eukprot:XP_001439165.1 hypothetical protein (macronuclear) [Paramecium tetraurelia strain d4-2]
MNNIGQPNDLQFIKRKSPYLLKEIPQKLVKISMMSQTQFKDFLESLSLNFTQLSHNLQQMLTLYNVQIFHENDDDQLMTDSDTDAFTKFQRDWLIKTICKVGVNHQFWPEIAQVLNKSLSEVKAFWITLQDNWTNELDNKLTQFRNQQLNWLEIALRLDKNKTNCKHRWNNVLDPSLCKSPFTIQDDILLLQKAIQLSFDWKKISKIVQPKRSQTDLISRFIKFIILIQQYRQSHPKSPIYNCSNSLNTIKIPCGFCLKNNQIRSRRLLQNMKLFSILDLNLLDAMALQFCLVKQDQIFFVTLEYMQQLVNLKLNQRKLLQFMK